MRKTFTPAVLLLLLLLSVVSGYAVPNKGEVQGLPTKGLILFMPFNGNANDESGNGNHGKVHGATLTLDRKGNPNGAYHFGGYHKKDYIKVPNSPSLKLDKEITMSIWVKQPLVQGMDGYGYKKDGHSMTLICKDGDRRGFYWMQTNHIQDRDQIIEFAGTWTGKNYGQVKSAPIHFSATKWKHYAVTYDLKRRTAKLFYNGKLISTKKYHHPDIFKQANNYDLYIGVFGYVGLWFPFEGELDDIRIYNRALSDKEVKAIYTQDSPQNNTTPPDPTPGDYSNYALKIHTWKSGLNENNLQYIAADGSSSIVLEVIGGKIPKGTMLTINTNNNNNYGTVYVADGSIMGIQNMYLSKWKKVKQSKINIDNKYIKFIAPDGLGDTENNERLVVLTITFPDSTKLTKVIRLIRTPVLFLHGKGSSKKAWKEMCAYFNKSNLYKNKELKSHVVPFNYKKFSEKGFEENTNKYRITKRGINHILQQLIQQGVLVQKVDVVSHSMGGVLTRTYLQSDYYDNDIHRMITMATPHSGTQSANLIYSLKEPMIKLAIKEMVYSFGLRIGQASLKLLGIYTIGNKYFFTKATENLRVNSVATNNFLNNKKSLSKQAKVPSFAVGAATLMTKKVEDYTGIPTGIIIRIFTKLACLKRFNLLFTDFYRTTESLYNQLFGSPHDIIVPIKSQLGGLSQEHYKVFFDTWHSGIIEKNEVSDYVLKLLQSPPDDPRWCHTGWKPETLTVPPGILAYEDVGVVKKIKPQDVLQSESSFVRFVPDKEEDNAVAGKEYTLNLEHSSDVVEIDVLVLGENYENLLNVKNPTSPTNIKISIPDSLIGDLHIMTFGKTVDSSAVVDNLLLHLENPKVKLESLSLEFANVEEEMNDPEVLIDMNISDWQQFSVMGHFSDGSVREITDFPGIEFATVNNKIDVTEPGIVFAKAEGIDTLKVAYQGKTAWKEFEITPYELDLIVFPKNAGEVDESHNKLNEDGYELKTLTPNAKDGYTFSGWFMDGDFVSYDEKMELPMIRPYQVVAYFEPKTGAAKIKGFAFPNPVKDNVTLSFDVVTPGVYTFELYQEIGQHLQTINKKYYSEGTHTIEFNTQALAPGRYFCQILRQGVSLGEIAFVVTK